MSWVLPLAIVKLSRLWVSDVETGLAQRGIPFRWSGADRPLHGCLVAYRGRGMVFLDGTDGTAEDRVAVA